MSHVCLTAPAKLTLSLRITGVRADEHHLLDAEMSTLDLADELFVDEAGSGITVGGPFGHGVPPGRSNLVAKALRLAGRHVGVRIVKHIPAGGGLGGGSADAAAILRWAGVTDLDLAATLGADVPFCLVGGRARVTGIGEAVEPLHLVTRRVTLVVPPLRVSTRKVYRAWDEMGGRRADGPNDLEPAAIVVEPRLRYWRDRIAELSGGRPILAGSGATWWLDGDHENTLEDLAAEGATVIPATTRA
ncbi:MAG: 4-(cytidine 5'-diphospho)-2-C-methyl-D-erythritol kinase [Actinomycetota bacterium]|nr:4-(cytidine 5'-diphospho)-2-C-methyl-D-erythritol kinase [Actinomycetota bacterium]